MLEYYVGPKNYMTGSIINSNLVPSFHEFGTLLLGGLHGPLSFDFSRVRFFAMRMSGVSFFARSSLVGFLLDTNIFMCSLLNVILYFSIQHIHTYIHTCIQYS